MHHAARSCLSYLVTLAVLTTLAQTQGPAGVPWKDAFGEPLPFQTDAEIIEFLRTAEIRRVEDLEVGVTDPRRVELVKDGVTLRAALRDFDHVYEQERFNREFYARLRDSFLFDLAAYDLSRMLGLDNVPPLVRRRVNGVDATLQIWVEGAIVEWDRFEQQVMPPDRLLYQKQRQNMLVFDTLIGNVDRNNGNILHDAAWKQWLIDHSRSFLRDAGKTPYLEEIQWCSRTLYASLKNLGYDELREALAPPLDDADIRAVLRRRDMIVQRLEALIAERGEAAVLFDDDAISAGTAPTW